MNSWLSGFVRSHEQDMTSLVAIGETLKAGMTRRKEIHGVQTWGSDGLRDTPAIININ
jgi:hypothetical protein